MGAYLHLLGLTELDDLSNFSPNFERSPNVNGTDPGITDVTSTSNSSGAGTTSREGSSRITMEMGDCASFWAGQLDGVFEGVRARTGDKVGASAHLVYDGRVERNMDNSSDQNLERHGNVDLGCERLERSESTCTEHPIRETEFSEGRSFATGEIKGSASSASLQDFSDSVRHANHGKGTVPSGTLEGEEFISIDCSGTLEGEEFISTDCRGSMCQQVEDESERLPDHLLIEILVRVPTADWQAVACVKKRWANQFRGDALWHTALTLRWPSSASTKRWPGPIAMGSSKRRYTSLYVSDTLFAKGKVEGVNEIVGHVYLFLREQLGPSAAPVSFGLLHSTIIDQFLACCKTGDEAHDLASAIWVAVLDNLDESEDTFHLLMRIAEEWEVFMPYPYFRSHVVQWRLFERLFTDFRHCLSQYKYFHVLTRARHQFEVIPQTWLGY